jgi:glycosyltransferase involved in cell wall biosynthesis
MRIAQMLDSLNWGGAQKMQQFLVETLHPLGIDITVISLRNDSNSTIPAEIETLGARVVKFPFPQLFSPGSFANLLKFMRREKFDLLHTYLTYSNIVGPVAGILSNVPVIASLRSADFGLKTFTRQREYLERKSLQHLAQRVMANGIVVGQYARKRLGEKVVIDVIPNSVDTFPTISEMDRLSIRAEILGDPKKTFILSVGRLTHQKGFPDLLKAFAELHLSHPLAVLAIAGGGDLQDELQKQINHLGVQGSALLLGDRQDARRLMAAADIYINSSHIEGTPVSVLEAMSAGLPVIATDVGETPFLLDEGAGLLVPPQQPDAIERALRSLLDSAEYRRSFSQSALARVSRVYSRRVWRKKMLELYAQVTPVAQSYLDQDSV